MAQSLGGCGRWKLVFLMTVVIVGNSFDWTIVIVKERPTHAMTRLGATRSWLKYSVAKTSKL